ncbi:MAG: hypothetical protein Q8P91_01610 [bacterium]|nr:hypothetical protein [bacterium]
MKKASITVVVVTIFILALGFFLVKEKPSESLTYPLPVDLTYYWGDGCPHCEVVADFLSTWEKKDVVTIDKKEVWNNAANAKELKARYESCGVPQSQMGVPLLFTPEGKCYTGDQPIIDFFKNIQ